MVQRAAVKRSKKDILKLNSNLEEKVARRTAELSKTVSKLLASNKKLEQVVIQKDRVTQALRKSEQELRASLEKEKTLGDLKSRFVTTASHEFRTPLSNILSSAEIIQMLLAQDKIEKIPKHLDRISKSVEGLTIILEEFLSLSKLEEGLQKVNFQTCNIVPIVEEAIALMNNSLKSGQHVKIEIQGDLPMIETDPKILRQILVNLLSNASKYSKNDSRIICNLDSTNGVLDIAIIDEGIGIPPDDIPHLFSKFFRSQNAINTPGTGLGLNIVGKFLQLIQGKIDVRSILNQGSTFTITLPLKPSEDEKDFSH